MPPPLGRLSRDEIDAAYASLWETICARAKAIASSKEPRYIIFEMRGLLFVVKRYSGTDRFDAAFYCEPDMSRILTWLASNCANEAPARSFLRVVPGRAADGSVNWHTFINETTLTTAEVVDHLKTLVPTSQA